MSAIALFRQLKGKGFEAVIHMPTDHNVRVLAGPYFDQTAASEAKSRLIAAGFRVISNWR